MGAEFTEDAVLGGKLLLKQPRRGHRFGHDALLLAAACPARARERVVDLGAGVGAAGLALALRVDGAEVTLVEVDPDLAALAAENARVNGLAARVRSVVLDVAAPAPAFAAAGLAPESVARVLMNPPFNDAARHRASPDKAREIAHVATASTLTGWIHAARRILKSGGVLSLIWRADGLAEILAALDRGFGSLVILPVHGDAAKPAIRLLVRAVKGGRAPTQILAALMLNNESAVPNKQVQDILQGKGVLPLAIP